MAISWPRSTDKIKYVAKQDYSDDCGFLTPLQLETRFWGQLGNGIESGFGVLKGLRSSAIHKILDPKSVSLL